MGLSLDWTLLSESAVTFAGFQIDPVSSGGPASQDHSGTAHPLLCFGLLPNPNNVVGEWIAWWIIFHPGIESNIRKRISWIWSFDVTHFKNHWRTSRPSCPIAHPVPGYSDRIIPTILPLSYTICECVLWWLLPAFPHRAYSNIWCGRLFPGTGIIHGCTRCTIQAWTSKRGPIVLRGKVNSSKGCMREGKMDGKWKPFKKHFRTLWGSIFATF